MKNEILNVYEKVCVRLQHIFRTLELQISSDFIRKKLQNPCSQAAKPLISEKWEKKGKVHFFAFLPYFNLIDWRDKQWHFATVGEIFFFLDFKMMTVFDL